MSFAASITLLDSYGRRTIKRIETDEVTLALAITALTAYMSALDDVTDLEATKIIYHDVETAIVFAGEALSNLDVGATFRVLLDNGKEASHKIPGFPASLVEANGAIDVAGAEVVAYFANFLLAGPCRLSDGNYVVEVLSGSLDR